MSKLSEEKLQELKDLLDYNPNLLTKYRLSHKHYLGGGLQGRVYGNKKYVIKFTGSKWEAMFAKQNLKKNYKYFVKFYSVEKIRGHNIWAIKMERLYNVPNRIIRSHYELYNHPHIEKAESILHKMGYYHGDVHNANVMYDSKKKVLKLIDFGFVDKVY
jgi:serine/threonine protein kinase